MIVKGHNFFLGKITKTTLKLKALKMCSSIQHASITSFQVSPLLEKILECKYIDHRPWNSCGHTLVIVQWCSKLLLQKYETCDRCTQSWSCDLWPLKPFPNCLWHSDKFCLPNRQVQFSMAIIMNCWCLVAFFFLLSVCASVLSPIQLDSDRPQNRLVWDSTGSPVESTSKTCAQELLWTHRHSSTSEW